MVWFLYSSKRANTEPIVMVRRSFWFPMVKGFLTPGCNCENESSGPGHAGSMPIPDNGYILSGEWYERIFCK